MVLVQLAYLHKQKIHCEIHCQASKTYSPNVGRNSCRQKLKLLVIIDVVQYGRQLRIDIGTYLKVGIYGTFLKLSIGLAFPLKNFHVLFF